MLLENLFYIALNLCSLYVIYKITVMFICPKIIDLCTKEVDRNPKGLVEGLRSDYYGFHDIDIVMCECPIYHVPRFREGKHGRLELFVPNNFSIWTRDRIANIALAGKIGIKYGIIVNDKPTYWLSILCYMLDGGDINVSETKWEKKD